MVILGGGRKAAAAVKLRGEAIINHASTEGRRMDAKLEAELRALVTDTVRLGWWTDAACWTPERKLLVRARLARRLSRAFGRVVTPDDITIRPPCDGIVDVALPCLSSPAVPLLDLQLHLRLPAVSPTSPA